MVKYSIRFLFPHQKITGTTSEQVGFDNPLAREVAAPLFDASVLLTALTGRMDYTTPYSFRDHHFLLLVLQGALTVRLKDKTYTQKPGMISFSPTTEPQSYTTKESPIWFLYFKLEDRRIWKPLKDFGSYIREYESADHMLLLLSRILDAHRTREINAKLNALEDSHALVNLLKRELRYVGKKPNRRAADLSRLASSIQRAPGRPWTLTTLAKEAHMAPRTLSRLFMEEYGVTPMNLVTQHRLNKAATLLIDTDNTIEWVAAESGYASCYTFSNLFLRHFGVRPGEFRKGSPERQEPKRQV